MNTSTAPDRSPSGFTLALLAFAMLIIAVDFNIVFVALPEIGRELGFTTRNLQWVVSAYAVTWGGFLLLGGRTVDRLGPRRMFILAMVLYSISSLAGGLARDVEMLIGARAVQGVGAAVLFPAVLALININFAEGRERNRAMAVWGAAASSGLIVGSTAGGLLTHLMGWPWVFFVNVPLALSAVVAAWWLLGRDPRFIGAGGFDISGALLATAGSTAVVFGLISGPDTGWGSIRSAGALMVGTLLLVIFLGVERRDANVLMPPRLFRHRSLVVAIGLVVVFMTAINFLHYSFFIQLQNGLGYDPLRAGLAFLPISIGGLVGSSKALPAILDRWGLRAALFVGTLGLGGSMAGLAPTLSPDGTYWLMLPSTLLWGLSAGVVYSAIFLAAGSGVTSTEHGVASATVSTTQQIGGAVGLAVLVAVASAGSATHSTQVTELAGGLRTSMWLGAAVVVAGAFLAFSLRRPTRHSELVAVPTRNVEARVRVTGPSSP